MFSLRIVTVDYYLSTPVKGFDVIFSDFRGAEIYKVPIIRVFGVTPAGQKSCLHVHGVFPYLSVPYDDGLPTEPTSSVYRKYSQELAYNIDKALNIAARKSNSNRHHVYKIILESRIPFYGYHETEQQFLKIFFYNPVDIKKTMELLSTGVIMNKVIQPYEAHIPYTLQFFIDYNLFGMNLINVDSLKFRVQHEVCENTTVHQNSPVQSCEKSFSCKIWDENSLKSSEMVSEIKKQTSCELEADCCATYILNHRDAKAKQGENPGLREIWEEERQRRRGRKESSQITPAESQERSQVLPTKTDVMYKGRLKQILRENKIRKTEAMSSMKDGARTSGQEEEINSSLSQDSMLCSQDKDMLSMVLSIINSESYCCDEDEDSILSCRIQKPDEKEDADETLEMSRVIVEDDDFTPECGFQAVSASPNNKMYDENQKKDGPSSLVQKSHPNFSPPPPVSTDEKEEDFKISQLDGTDDLDDFLNPKFQKSRKIPSLQSAVMTQDEKLSVVSTKTKNNLKKSKNLESKKTCAPVEDGTSRQPLEYSYSQHSVCDSFNEGKKIMCLKKIKSRTSLSETDSLSDFHPKKQKNQAISPSKKCSDSGKPSSRLRRRRKYLPISGIHTLSPSKSNSREEDQNAPVQSCKEHIDDTYSSPFSVKPTSFRRHNNAFDSGSDQKMCPSSSNDSLSPYAITAGHTNENYHDLIKRNPTKIIKYDKLYSKSHKSRNLKGCHTKNLRKAVEPEIKKITSSTSHNGNIPSGIIIPLYAKQFDLRKIGFEEVALTKLALNNTSLSSYTAVNDDNVTGAYTGYEQCTQSENMGSSDLQNIIQNNSENVCGNIGIKMNKPLKSQGTSSALNDKQTPKLPDTRNAKVLKRLSLKKKWVKPVNSFVPHKLNSCNGLTATQSKNRRQSCEEVTVANKKVLNISNRNASTETELLKVSNLLQFDGSLEVKVCDSCVTGEVTSLSSTDSCSDKKLTDSCRNQHKCQTSLNIHGFLHPEKSKDVMMNKSYGTMNFEDCFKTFGDRPENKASPLSSGRESSKTTVTSNKSKQGIGCVTSKKQVNKVTKKGQVASVFQSTQSDNYNSPGSNGKNSLIQRQNDISPNSLDNGGFNKNAMLYSSNIQEQYKSGHDGSSSIDKQLYTFSTTSGKTYSLRNCKVVLTRINIEEEAKCEPHSDKSHPGPMSKTQVFEPLCITTNSDFLNPITKKFDQLEPLSLNLSSESHLKSNEMNQSLAVKLGNNVRNKDEDYQDVLYNLAFLSPSCSYSDPSTSPPHCWSPNALASDSLGDDQNCDMLLPSSLQHDTCENLHLLKEKVASSSSAITKPLNNLLDSNESDLMITVDKYEIDVSEVISEKNGGSSQSLMNSVRSDVCIPNYILCDVQKLLDHLVTSVDEIVSKKANGSTNKVAKNCENVPKTLHNSVLQHKSGKCYYEDCAQQSDVTSIEEIESLCKLKSKKCDFNSKKCISHKKERVSVSSSPESLELFASSGSGTSIADKQLTDDSFQALSPSVIDLSPGPTEAEIDACSISEVEEQVRAMQNVSATSCLPNSSRNVSFIKEKVADAANEQPLQNENLFERKNLPSSNLSDPYCQVSCGVNNLHQTVDDRSSFSMVSREVDDVKPQKNDTKNKQTVYHSSLLPKETISERHSIEMAEKLSDSVTHFSKGQNSNSRIPKLHSRPAGKANHSISSSSETKDSFYANSLSSLVNEENSLKLNPVPTINENTISSATEGHIHTYKQVSRLASSSSMTKDPMEAKLECSSTLIQNALQPNTTNLVTWDHTVIGNSAQKHGVTDTTVSKGEMEVTENEGSIMGKSKQYCTSSDESNCIGSHIKNISSEKSIKESVNNISATTENETTVKEMNINETISHEKGSEPLPLIINLPAKRLSEGDLFDDDHLEPNLSEEDSLCYDAPVQSFYNYQSLTLQNSSEWNDSAVSCTSQNIGTCVAAKKSFVLQPKFKAPTREEVESSCELYDIPETRHQDAFFSNPLDTAGGGSLMGHIPRAKSTRTSELLNFDTKFRTDRMNIHPANSVAEPKITLSSPSSSFYLPDAICKNPEMKITLAGNRLVVLTPACFPPSHKKVEEWVKLHRTKVLPKQETPQSSRIINESDCIKLEASLGSLSSKTSQIGSEENLKINPEIVISCVPDSSLKPKAKISFLQEEISPIFPLATEANMTPNKSLREYRHFKKSLHSVSTPVSQFRFKKLHKCSPSTSLQNCQTTKSCGNSNNDDSLCESGNSPLSPVALTEISIAHSLKRKRKLFENDREGVKLSPRERLKPGRAARDGKLLSKAVDTFTEQNNSSCSQIEGPSYENTGNYKVNLGKIGDARSVHMNQYLTIMSVEIHVNTRNDLRPDPEHDAVCTVFYYIHNDVAHGHYLRQELLGIIILDADVRDDSGVGSHTENNTADSNIEDPLIADNLQGSKPCDSQLNCNNQSEPAGNIRLQNDSRDSTCDSVLKNSFASKMKTELMIKIGVENVCVTSVHNENMLFKELSAVVERWDPDILVGYEIQMLSWGYLLQRASHLNINLLSALSRIQESDKEPIYNPTSSTVLDEYGSEHSSEIHIDGRIVLNVWRIMRKEVTLNRYSFENVFYHVLHQRTPLYSFESLTAWYNGKPFMKQKVFDYYAIRTWGTAKLLDHLDVVARTSELARVFGIQFYDVLNRGSQFRVESMMLRCTKSSNYIPVSPTVRQRSSSRAPECIPLIMEPESRFYTDPVVVLDFQSLYPSMMIAYNYCFSTCLGRIEHLGKNAPFDFGCTSLNIAEKLLLKMKNNIHFSPTGIAFVKSTVRQGILPQLLNEILTTRIMVKQSMKAESTDKTLKKLLDARQLGLKLIANVTYGYTSANYSGRMPCVEVADSIVGKARETLERAIRLVEDNPNWKARVVYGDTDSMFVLLRGRSKDQAFKIGQEIADVVTQMNPKPVKLKFEKVYLPCVLQAKKHYVGFMYETPDQKDPVYDAKGIETVRRDTCPAVSKILEKSLKILFNTRDVSLVKVYVQKQFSKLLSGRSSIIDCIFAKEYRGLGGYRPSACVPALEIAKRRLRKDPRSEPRVGERVPYVIIYGFPTQPLIQLVKEPEDLLEDKSLHINSKYYITRVIIPPLDRVFSLIGIDVRTWYANMPHLHAPSLPVIPTANHAKGRTLSQYFTALSCPVCDQPTNLGICSSCQQDPQVTCVILNDKVRQWERICDNLNKICASCTKSKDCWDLCLSIDCPVMFRLNRAKKDLSQASYIRNVLLLDFF